MRLLKEASASSSSLAIPASTYAGVRSSEAAAPIAWWASPSMPISMLFSRPPSTRLWISFPVPTPYTSSNIWPFLPLTLTRILWSSLRTRQMSTKILEMSSWRTNLDSCAWRAW